MTVGLIIGGGWLFVVGFAVSLTRAAAVGSRVADRALLLRDERRAHAALYPRGGAGVSSVCASSPRFGEAPVLLDDDEEA